MRSNGNIFIAAVLLVAILCAAASFIRLVRWEETADTEPPSDVADTETSADVADTEPPSDVADTDEDAAVGTLPSLEDPDAPYDDVAEAPLDWFSKPAEGWFE